MGKGASIAVVYVLSCGWLVEVLRDGEIEHERIAVDAHVQVLVEQQARDRLESVRIVDVQLPTRVVVELDEQKLVRVDEQQRIDSSDEIGEATVSVSLGGGARWREERGDVVVAVVR